MNASRWAVSCGCDYHGDHLGCDQSCEDYGCVHPLGVEITAATEEEADACSGKPVRVEEPAGERVAQSANADVRRDALVQAVNGNPISADDAWALIHDFDARREAALPGALPVPVGDATEALRAELEATRQALADLTPSPDGGYGPVGEHMRWADAYVERLLEANRTRDALQEISALRLGTCSGMDSKFDRAQHIARAALADSGEAGS